MTPKAWIKNLLVYDPSDTIIRRGASAFADDLPAFNASAGARSFTDALSAMTKYCHVESVIFETHGSPGYVHFPDGGIDSNNAHRFCTVASVLEEDARILFEGCHVGADQLGRDFLLTVGASLLRGKGGFVGGTTSYNLGSPLELIGALDAVHMPPWGKLRVLQFDKSGSLLQEREVAGSLFGAP